MNKIILRIDHYTFKATLYNNDTVTALMQQLPLSILMNDLYENEKYCYLKQSFPTQEEYIGHICEGDIMLFGQNCLVIFYKTFDTNYPYTPIGHIDDITHLKAALKDKETLITFEMEE